ncbi:MAG: hypothetical protein ACO3QC_01520, partial [Phycisphaerales bacterium]
RQCRIDGKSGWSVCEDGNVGGKSMPRAAVVDDDGTKPPTAETVPMMAAITAELEDRSPVPVTIEPWQIIATGGEA